MFQRALLIICAIFILIALLPKTASAFTFNPNNIITDFDLKDKNSMSLNAIQAFLDKYESVLKAYSEVVNQVSKSAAEIIYEKAQEYFISPKFILTKLDHEQCLIRGCSFLNDPLRLKRALDWATGFSVCDSCKGVGKDQYRGFANQVDALASVQNDYIRKSDKPYIYARGKTFTTRDGALVTPANQATANLYTYTPYQGGTSDIGGNYFFAKLWNNYWGALRYPDGTILKDDSNRYWLIDGGMRRLFASESVYLTAHTAEDSVTVSSAALDEYSEGPAIKFANYSLVRDETGAAYLLVDGRKRKIEDDETFRLLGFNPEEVEQASSAELGNYPSAVSITRTVLYPQGILAKEQGSGDLYWVQNGFKYVVSGDIALVNYRGMSPQEMSPQELSQYYPGAPQKIKDGKFVKSPDGDIYMATRGILRPIASMADFVSLFGENKISQIAEVGKSALALHEIGEKIEASSYERNNESAVAGAKTAAEPREYKALWVGGEAPSALVVGKTYTLKVRFKNKGNALWEKGDVYAAIAETGGKAANDDIVPVGAEYGFMIPVAAASKDITTLSVTVYGKDGTSIKGGWYQTKIRVTEPLYSADIVSHTLPIAVRSGWTRVAVKIRVKNTGKEPWTRKKTGLRFLKEDGSSASPFYDSSDWVDATTASVALEPRKDAIAPGEEAVFAFTLKTRGVGPGMYGYRIALSMSDKEESVLLNGSDFYEGAVRVDK